MIEAMNNLRNGKLEATFRPADDDGLFSFELAGTLTADFMGEPSGRVTGRIAGGVGKVGKRCLAARKVDPVLCRKLQKGLELARGNYAVCLETVVEILLTV